MNLVSAGKPLTHALDQYAADLGGRSEESNRVLRRDSEKSTGAI
jgi:hypothetical protein